MSNQRLLDEDAMELSSWCSDGESFDSMDASCSGDESLCFDTDEEDMLSVSSDDSSKKVEPSEGVDEEPQVVAAMEEAIDTSSASPSPALLVEFDDVSLLPQVIKMLTANEDDYTHLNLSFQIIQANGCTKEFSALLKAIRCNRTVTRCTVGSDCFLGLNTCQTRALVDAIGGLPALKTLVLDSSVVEFLTTLSFCTKWKRDQHFHLYQQHCEFQNKSVKEVLVTGVPSDIVEGFLGHLVMLAIFNFAALERLNVNFTDDFSNPQEVLMRVALTALSYSRNLMDMKFGNGEHNLIMEVSASRTAEVLRVLKLRCNGEQLTPHSYMAIAQMLHMHSKTLNGLVLETAVDNDGALTIAKTLGHNINLKALCLGTFDCRDQTRRDGLVSLLSRVLHTPQQQQQLPLPQSESTRQKSLEYLSLVCQELDDAGIQDISNALSQSGLKELILFLDNELDTTISGRGIAALANVLEVNKTIEDFSVICNAIDDAGIMAIARVLKNNNRTLKHLKLQCSNTIKVTAQGYQAIVDMLEDNTVLQSFDLGCIQDPDEDDEDDIDEMNDGVHSIPIEYSSAIDFYIKLNQAGVRNLHLNFNTAPDQFLNAVVSQRSEIDNLYYILSKNPSFVSFGHRA